MLGLRAQSQEVAGRGPYLEARAPFRYQLTIGPAEHAALANVLNGCPNETITVTLAV